MNTKTISTQEEYSQMETTHKIHEIATNLNDKELNEEKVSENQLVYQNFATKPTDSFLGTPINYIKESPSKKIGSMSSKRRVSASLSTLSEATMNCFQKDPSWLRKYSCPSKSPNIS